MTSKCTVLYIQKFGDIEDITQRVYPIEILSYMRNARISKCVVCCCIGCSHSTIN